VEEEYEAAGGEVLLDNEDNDGWLATHGRPKGWLLAKPHYFVYRLMFELKYMYLVQKLNLMMKKTCLQWSR